VPKVEAVSGVRGMDKWINKCSVYNKGILFKPEKVGMEAVPGILVWVDDNFY
jgi:hypothetical protein